MASFNKVILVGNLTRDPERRYTPKGTAVTEFALAINRVYSTETGERKEEVHYFDVVVWGKQAENCAQYLSKGRPALVEGRLVQDRWQDKDTGANRSRIRVHAETVQFLGGKPQGGGADFNDGPPEEVGGPAPAAAPAPARRPYAPPARPAARPAAPANEGGAEEAPPAPAEKDDIPF